MLKEGMNVMDELGPSTSGDAKELAWSHLMLFLLLLLPPAAVLSRSEENFHDALLACPVHGIDTTRERIFFADQAINVDGAFL
jgi:hypothetical protein